MTMPNFLIIGAGKGGTSSLYAYLKQHPQIYMSPVKETNFFALEGEKLDFRGPGADTRINSWSVNDIESYRALFNDVKDEKAIGEASPLYLYSAKAPERIKYYIPDVKLIAILRNPADRAYSAYLWLLGQKTYSPKLDLAVEAGQGREPIVDFAKALEAEETRIQNHWEWIWHYKNMGFYYNQLQRYFNLFSREQIKIYLYEDLKSNSVGLLHDMYSFLGVDDSFKPNTSEKHAASYIPPKSKALNEFLLKNNPFKDFIRNFIPANIRQPLSAKVYRKNMAQPQHLSPKIKQQLIETYREDILQLQDLLKRDLSSWLET